MDEVAGYDFTTSTAHMHKGEAFIQPIIVAATPSASEQMTYESRDG
jgi:hypothetical protein